MDCIQDDVTLPQADFVFAPHHGRDSGKLPKAWLDQLTPKIIIIGEAPSKHLNYYDGYNTITQNSAGDIILDVVSEKVHIYVSSADYQVDFLIDEKQTKYSNYLGTLHV
jgi:hypothetical protein